MGGFNTFGTVLGAVSQVANLTSGARRAYGDYRHVTSAYQQARNQYQQTEREINQQADMENRRLQLEREEETRKRRNTLQRSVASQQARFSGQGIDTTDGSGEAALLGLYEESAEQKAYRDRMDRLKQEALSQDTANRHRRNLLTLQNSYGTARDRFIGTLDNFAN